MNVAEYIFVACAIYFLMEIVKQAIYIYKKGGQNERERN